MKTDQINSLFNKFQTRTELRNYSEIVSGHINDTFLIETSSDKKFVLQRINHKVFPNVPGLMNNKVLVSHHLLKKVDQNKRRVLEFIPVSKELYYYKDEDGNFWSLSVFIEDSITYETVPNVKIAQEGGRLTGEFLKMTADLEVKKFVEVIPKFHDMSFRFEQFQEALNAANTDRINSAQEDIQFCIGRKEEMLTLQKLKETGKIPIRITHNDTKISNILFNSKGKGVAMIDTDTVMPGIIHYDYGDALRTICNSAVEDEQDLSKVEFNINFYNSYTDGFMEGLGTGLNEIEKQHLPTGVKTMIFIMALRFLTDYLNNDVYYKTKYEDHNLVRSRNQLKLLTSFEEKLLEA